MKLKKEREMNFTTSPSQLMSRCTKKGLTTDVPAAPKDSVAPPTDHHRLHGEKMTA